MLTNEALFVSAFRADALFGLIIKCHERYFFPIKTAPQPSKLGAGMIVYREIYAVFGILSPYIGKNVGRTYTRIPDMYPTGMVGITL